MKIHVLSDLHLEFAPFAPAETDADVVVLAGDIWNGGKGIVWARDTFRNQEIVYVAGNHEFYGTHWERLPENCQRMARACGVHFLENAQVEIGGVRCLGASLWVDFDLRGEAYRAADMRLCADT
jgi:predicted phosphodiesterase